MLVVLVGVVVYLATHTAPIRPWERGEKPIRQHGQVVKKHHLDRGPNRSGIQAIPDGQPHSLPSRRQLAIIIDDIGQDQAFLESLLQLDFPVTVAILPYCLHSRAAAEMAHRAGRDVLLHLPMEPQGYPARNPGEGALLTTMSEEELTAQLSRDLNAVPYVKGVNNHMGSRFMEDEARLEIVFRALGQRRLFFVDSRTTANTRAAESAEKADITFWSRDVFIDNNGDPEETYQLLIKAVRTKGSGLDQPMILIGHPYPGTLLALKRMLKDLSQENIELVSVSQLRGRAN